MPRVNKHLRIVKSIIDLTPPRVRLANVRKAKGHSPVRYILIAWKTELKNSGLPDKHSCERWNNMPPTVVGQTTTMNCGAACLLCAAIELNATPGATLANRVNRPLGVDQFWLNAIYNISGGGGDGYSMPSGVIAAARQLGMSPQAIAANTKTVSALEKKYPHEMANIVNDLIRVSNKNLGDVTLKANQRAMHCVRIGDLTPAVHWVLQRDDNSYMDPAGGATQLDIAQGGATLADRATLKATGQSTFLANSYHGTGLAIILSV